MAAHIVAAVYTLSCLFVVGFGAVAVTMAYYRTLKVGQDTAFFFLTAKRSLGPLMTALSFFAATLGAESLFRPSVYAYTAGVLGLVMYALSSGGTILLQSFLGSIIQRRLPGVLSFSDYAFQRFGRTVQIWVSLLMILNMGVALTAEYTAVGDLFAYVIGTTRVPIVLLIGFVTTVYTAAGGLYVSIKINQWQSGLSILLIAVTTIYVAASFDEPLPKPLPSQFKGATSLGYSSLIAMPASIISASIFSEVIWQRCWASANSSTLKVGALWGSALVLVASFLLGFAGILAGWSGLVSGTSGSVNTIFFAVINSAGERVGILVVVSVLAVVMSESAVDALQNALVNNVGGVFLKGCPIWWIRGLVILLNIPPMVISLQGYDMLKMFLLTSLLTSTSTLPILAGLLRGDVASRLVSPVSVLFGCIFSFVSLLFWGIYQSQHMGLSYKDAMHHVFLDAYDWQPFLIALLASVIGMGLGAAAEFTLRWTLRLPYIAHIMQADEEQPPVGKDGATEPSEGDEDCTESPSHNPLYYEWCLPMHGIQEYQASKFKKVVFPALQPIP